MCLIFSEVVHCVKNLKTLANNKTESRGVLLLQKLFSKHYNRNIRFV